MLFIFYLITDTKFTVAADYTALSDDSLINFCILSYMSALHDDGIRYHSTFLYYYLRSDNGVVYTAVNLGTFTYNTAGKYCILAQILSSAYITLGIDLPELFIQVKVGNQIDKFHV